MAKIFVPLGTQKFPFKRLIIALNNLVEKGIYRPEDIVMQSTIYDIKPIFTHVELVITHAGVNSIISCMQKDKALLIVPRLHKYKEHVDNHQVEIAQLMEQKYNMLVLYDISSLEEMIPKAKVHKYKKWESHKASLIEAIKKEII